METGFPFQFQIAVALLAGGVVLALSQLKQGAGVPLLAGLASIIFWYFGDVYYNSYDYYALQFRPQVLELAWAQVAVFIFFFILFAQLMTRGLRGRSLAYRAYRYPLNRTHEFQSMISNFFVVIIVLWIVCLVSAVVLIGSDVVHFLLPFIGDRANPFARARIGGGFSALVSLVGYLYLLVGAGAGVILALTRNKKLRMYAMILCVSVWSFYLLDRTRNSMLVVCLPGFLSWVFFKLNQPLMVRAGYLFVGVLVLSLWMAFVMAARDSQTSVQNHLSSVGWNSVAESQSRHAGLNMFEELCWITNFMLDGRLKANEGERYLAELANPIPRALWSNKPTIGLEYAILRGQRSVRGGEAVTATVSTGLIGQGTTNFGLFYGPLAAAFLFALWVRLLSDLDTKRQSLNRFPIYIVGLVLTFNMGRDITLLTLYPFFFGLIAINLFENSRLFKQIRMPKPQAT